MKVSSMMTHEVACCTPETSLQDVARMMVDNDCGGIPVCSGNQGRRPIGMITDRDIVCRTLARGRNPMELQARDAMTGECVAVHQDTKLKDCCETMEKHQVRRIFVVDDAGDLCGIVSTADIARVAPKQRTAEVVQQVSQPEGIIL